MKSAALIAFSFCLLLLLGCIMPWEGELAPQNPQQQQNATNPPAQNQSVVQNQAQAPAENENSGGVENGETGGIDWGEVNGEENVAQENVTQAENATAPAQEGNVTNATAAVNNTGETKTAFSRPASSKDVRDGTFGLVQTPDAALNVYFIDVGFGNAVLVNKGTFNMLIDAGPASQGGKVASFVTSHGISRLNAVVATHDDANSIGGLPTVLDSVPADEVWLNGVAYNSTQSNAIYARIAQLGIPVKYPVAGQSLFVNALNISIMNPQKQKLMGSSESDAIIVRLAYGNFCVPLLDPTVHEIEPALLSSGVPVNKCQVVQYFNRGEGRGGMEGYSRLVEGNMNALKDVVISVGPSQYDLPSRTTLDRFAIHGWTVYRTDTGGTITVSSDGKNYTMSKEK